MTDPSAILAECQQLRDGFKSVLMATLNAAGEPEASYTPYLYQDDRFYIFVSQLSAHTQNLQIHGRASLLFIEDERDSRNLFARKRLSLQVTATAIERSDPHWHNILDAMQAQLGNTVEMLRALPDFVLFELQPQRGNFVKGFGQAYFLEGPGLTQVRQAMGK